LGETWKGGLGNDKKEKNEHGPNLQIKPRKRKKKWGDAGGKLSFGQRRLKNNLAANFGGLFPVLRKRKLNEMGEGTDRRT